MDADDLAYFDDLDDAGGDWHIDLVRPELSIIGGGCVLFLIGRDEDFVDDITLYRLKGERADVWRPLSRPPDEIAQHVLRDEVGCYLEEALRRPSWVFNDPPVRSRWVFEPEIRLVDGLLCGCRVLRDEWGGLPLDLQEPQWIGQLACTVDGLFECVYLRPAGARFAYFVSQEARPPGAFQKYIHEYRRNCPWLKRFEPTKP